MPEASIRATAQYDAAAAYIGLGDWARSAAVLGDFRKRYPDHELQADIDKKLALVYLESGEPGRAAGEFQRIAAALTFCPPFS